MVRILDDNNTPRFRADETNKEEAMKRPESRNPFCDTTRRDPDVRNPKPLLRDSELLHTYLQQS